MFLRKNKWTFAYETQKKSERVSQKRWSFMNYGEVSQKKWTLHKK